MEPIISPLNSDIPKSKQKFNRKASVFAVCLCISGFFWVVTTLSMPFTASVRFPVTYINLPKDKLVSNNLPDTLELELKGSGFAIIRCHLKKHPEPIVLDASGYRPHKGSDYFYLAMNPRIESISRQVDRGLKIQSIVPDTIFLNFSRKVSKTVPVHTRMSLGFMKEFAQGDSVLISPSEVRISGSQATVEKVKEVRTEDLHVENLNRTTVIRKALIKSAELKQLEFSVDSVSIQIPVLKFTEGTAEIPIEPVNLPAGTSLKVFPDKIRVTYLVAFAEFEKIKPEMFRAIVDFSKQESGNSKLRVELSKVPSMVRSVSINPEKVEYILRK